MTNHEPTHNAPDIPPTPGFEHEPIPAPRVLLGTTEDDESGWWVDATGSPEDVIERAGSRHHILDITGFGDFRLLPGDTLDLVRAVAGGITIYGLAYAAWAELHDADPAMLAAFSDHYLNHFDSLAAFGEHLAASTDGVSGALEPDVRIDFTAVGMRCATNASSPCQPRAAASGCSADRSTTPKSVTSRTDRDNPSPLPAPREPAAVH